MPTWQDKVREIALDHRNSVALVPSWTQKQTGEKFGLSQKGIHMVLTVADYFHDPKIAGAKNVEPAYKILLKRRNRAKNKTLERLIR